MRRNPIAFLSIFFPSLAIMSLNKKKGVPVSETVTLVGGTDDGDMVCNEGLSLEHWGETAVTHQRGKLI